MSSRTLTRLAGKVILTAALALAAPAVVQADAPGYEFMDFPEGMALVIDPGALASAGKTPKGVVSEKEAAEIVEGTQPVSSTSIVLFYHGKVYIVPDKKMPSGKMASDMVKSAGAGK